MLKISTATTITAIFCCSAFIVMSHTLSGTYRAQKWYNSNIFPLIPVLSLKKANEHNTGGFTFRWLFITLWTLDSVQFEFAITADNHWGLGFKGLLPYLRWVVAIPCPEKLGIWIDKHFSRRIKH
ncbi:hypothetical protein G1K37_09545 [Tenacibaculum dicentrarchi]|nr:hypothetical protein [Tenacibaculum dicentrarchi]